VSHLVYTERVGGSSPSPPTIPKIPETLHIFQLPHNLNRLLICRSDTNVIREPLVRGRTNLLPNGAKLLFRMGKPARIILGIARGRPALADMAQKPGNLVHRHAPRPELGSDRVADRLGNECRVQAERTGETRG
jgi:hypothetical protein